MQPTAILVVGAPRSGTSAISHVVSSLGVDFGDQSRFVDVQVHSHNPIFFELKSLNALNEEVIGWLGHRYASGDFMPLREDFDAEVVERFAPLCRDLVRREFGDSGLIGLKDPRFCFLLPLWRDALTRLGYCVRCIWVVRDLGAVIHSNERVNANWARARNMRIAALSVLSAAYVLADTDHIRVNYDDALADPAKTAQKLLRWIDHGASGDAVAVAAGVLNAGLRTVKARDQDIPPECARISSEMLDGTLRGERYRDLVGLVRCMGLEPARATSDDAVLYFRHADGEFSADDSVGAVVTPGADGGHMAFRIPADGTADVVRFDPAAQSGAFAITGLRVNGASVDAFAGRARRVNQYVLDGRDGRSVWLASFDDDPYIEFDLAGLAGADHPVRTIEIDCRQLDLDGAAGPFVMSMLGKVFASLDASSSAVAEQTHAQLEALSDANRRVETKLADGAIREAELNQRVGSIQERNTRLEDELTRSKATAATLAQQVEAARADAARLEVELSSATSRAEQTLRESFWLSAKSVRANERVAAAGRALQDANVRLADLERDHGALRDQHASLETAHNALRDQHASLETAHNALHQRLGALHEHSTALEHSCAVLQSANSELRTELDGIRASTMWRVFVRCRTVLLRIPAPLRSVLRKSVKTVWWLVTPWRLPARLRFLRDRRSAASKRRG